MRRSEAARPTVVDDILRYAIAIGATLVLLLPAARGHHEALGWLPLWLLGMPLSAWVALRWSRRAAHDAVTAVPAARREAAATRRRRPGPQARRRAAARTGLPRAA
jgi:hypothetical protein